MNKVIWLCIFSCFVGLAATSLANDNNLEQKKDIDGNRNNDVPSNLEKLLKKLGSSSVRNEKIIAEDWAPISPRCKSVPLKSQCSPNTKRRKGCQYNEQFIQEGTEVYITPCEFCRCDGGQVFCAIIDCAPIPLGCKAIPVEGQCCPKIECKGGCEYNGQFIAEGTEVHPTPCEFCRCDGGEVSCAVMDCAQPPDGCKPIAIEGQCCPSYDCKGGCEYKGQFIQEGTEVNITPCEFCRCDGGQVFCAIIDCAPIPLGCKAIPVEGQCCPKVECKGGCEYNGQFIAEGTEVHPTPCEFCRCDGGEVSCAVMDCAQPPVGCKPIAIEGQCCPSYDCKGGCEYNGQFIQEGSEVKITPCELCRCDGGEVYCAVSDCAQPPDGCKQILVEGECCPRYDCNTVV